MTVLRVIASLVVLSLWAITPAAHAGGRVEVLAFDPEPNYAPTRDENDAAQLVDGRYSRYPAWTDRQSVGWVNRTPAVIMLKAATIDGGRHALVLRTARQSRAGVMPPRRVDVYCRTRFSSAWRHAGAWMHAATDSADGGPVDIVVPVAGCGGTQLQVVVHAEGVFIMLDELTFDAQGGSEATALSTGRVDVPREDSKQRLVSALMKRAQAKLADAVVALPGAGSHAGLVEPWGALAGPATADALEVHALPGVPARYVIGLANTGSAARRYAIAPEDIAADRAVPVIVSTLQWLDPVMAADGQLAFDVPIVIDAPLVLPPGHMAFLLVTEPPGGVSGVRRWRVSDDAGWSQRLTVDLVIHDLIQPSPSDRPHVLVWTYTRDTPIWSTAQTGAILDRLTTAGVNVFEVHPRDIPQPFAEIEWPARTAALRHALALYRGRGLVLLLLGAEGWNALSSMQNDTATRQALARWVSQLATTLREAGYADGDWALYPLDEPRGDNVGQLAKVVDTLRDIEPSLRFYANPIAERGPALADVFRLRALVGRIDYWQPRAGAAFTRVQQLLENSPDDAGHAAALWLYANPPAPARSALPACYRDLGRLAYAEGARGLGFWSFSDTGASSAWSDFDGQRPDWAVAYESRADDGPFVASRRWLAFVEGIANHAALRHCTAHAAGDPLLARQCHAFRRALEASRADCRAWLQ